MAKTNNNFEVPVPLESWVRQIVEETARTTAEKVLKQHKTDCAVHDLKRDVYGTETSPGLKIRTDRMESTLKSFQGARAYLRDLSKIVIAALILALIAWQMKLYRHGGDRSEPARPTAAQPK